VTEPIQQPADFNFESGLTRLEEILEKMNSSTISLDESLKLFEEADKLITNCNDILNKAEKKISILIKNRTTGELALGSDKKPIVDDFPSPPK
jgi:exodeoxyribonuclease VII small subunit